MSFQVGQKVVCVDDSPGHATGNKTLVYGQIYTVLAVDFVGDPTVDEPSGLAWGKWRFRPIDYSFGEKVCEEITKVSETETIEV